MRARLLGCLLLAALPVPAAAQAGATAQGAATKARPSSEVEVHTPLSRQRDAMSLAIAQRNLAKVRELLRAGLKPDFDFDEINRGRSGESPLTMSIFRGHLDIARALLEAGANPDRLDNFGQPPIHQARTPEAIQLLLEFKANPDARSKRGDSAVDEMRRRGDHAAAEAMQSRGVRATAPGPDLWKLIESGDTEGAKRLLAAGANPDAARDRETLLTRALFRKRWQLALALADAGASLKLPNRPGCGRDFPDCGPVQIARFASFDPPTLAALKAKGLDLDAAGADGHTALTLIVLEQPMRIATVDGRASLPPDDNVARVRNLLAQGANPNRKFHELTPLMLALAAHGKPPELVAALFEAGGRIEFEGTIPPPGKAEARRAANSASEALGLVAPNALGELTGMQVGPLGWAVLLRHPGIAQRHLERDQSIRPEDRNVVYFAALHGDWALVLAVLRFKADANARDRAGVTPLMFAANAGEAQAIRALLAAGAQANARSATSWPPLLEGGYARFIGGHPPSKPPLVGGLTALGIAKAKGNAEAARLLAEAGGRD